MLLDRTPTDTPTHTGNLHHRRQSSSVMLHLEEKNNMESADNTRQEEDFLGMMNAKETPLQTFDIARTGHAIDITSVDKSSIGKSSPARSSMKQISVFRVNDTVDSSDRRQSPDLLKPQNLFATGLKHTTI